MIIDKEGRYEVLMHNGCNRVIDIVEQAGCLCVSLPILFNFVKVSDFVNVKVIRRI